MARGRITNGKAPQGKSTKGKPISRGGPGFIGARGSSRTTAAGGKRGKGKITTRGSGKTASGRFS